MIPSLDLAENEWKSLTRDLNACMGNPRMEMERYGDEHIHETGVHMKKNAPTGRGSGLDPDRSLPTDPVFDLEPFVTMERYLDKFRELVPGTDAAYHLDIPESDIPNLIRIVLFPVLEEALHNVRRHSGADRVRIGVQKKNRYLILTVSDNGRGFDMEKRFFQEQSGMGKGLMRIREWVELLDGVFMLNSTEHSGTTLSVSLPTIE